MIPRQSKIRLEASPVGKGVVDGVTDVNLALEARMIEQEQVLGLLSTAQVIAGAEVRRTSAKQSVSRERVITTARSKLNVIDNAAANTPSLVRVQRVRKVDDISIRLENAVDEAARTISLLESATLFVVTDQDKAHSPWDGTEGNVLQPRIKGVFKERADPWRQFGGV